MSDKDNYAPGTYNDPNAPWNQEDITDTQAFEVRYLEIWEERVKDINGYMIEGITERPDEDLKALARMVWGNTTGTHTTTIGAYITKWVMDYCKPCDEEIIDILNDEAEYAADMAAEARYEQMKDRD